jgi:uncharacterized membrane protein YphA (DoxX/SURF4 family)
VNTLLWVVQVLLALVFLGGGLMKLLRTKAALEPSMGFVANYSAAQVKGIGAVEVLAALGLILPALTGVVPVLTPLAAVGVVLIMIGAVVTHGRRGEHAHLTMNVLLLVLALVVAWGRFGPYAR